MTTYTWNVYKIFANGKRAKKPVFEFTYNDPDTAFSFFEDQIKPNFTQKQQKCTYTLLRTDLPQENIQNSINEEDEKNKNISKKIFMHLDEEKKVFLSDKNSDFALMIAKETDWEWQWCAVSRVNFNFITSVSPKFAKYSEANDWINQKTQNE